MWPLWASVWRSNVHYESQKTRVCNAYYRPLLSNFFKFPEAARTTSIKMGWAGGRGWRRGGWEVVGDQWCWDIKIKCFCFTLALSYFMFKLKLTLNFLLTFS